MEIVTAILIFQSLIILILLYWVNTLLNKCMSRSFYDYQISKGMAKSEKSGSMNKVDLKEESDAEDLAYIM